jgi:hypothetical protein
MTVSMNRLPAQVAIREVGPRDGLQNEEAVLHTADKVRLIDALALRKICTTSTRASTARRAPTALGAMAT